MIAVTGGGGFLGGAVVRRLLARGDAVRSVQRSDAPALRELGASVVRADLADRDAVLRALEGCDAVVLGCTEIPLIVTTENSPLPVLDSTRLLARAALRRAVG